MGMTTLPTEYDDFRTPDWKTQRNPVTCSARWAADVDAWEGAVLAGLSIERRRTGWRHLGAKRPTGRVARCGRLVALLLNPRRKFLPDAAPLAEVATSGRIHSAIYYLIALLLLAGNGRGDSAATVPADNGVSGSRWLLADRSCPRKLRG